MSRNFNRSVVVTGIGVLAPNGVGVKAFWDSIKAKESGIDYITLFDASEQMCKFAGEVKNFEPGDYMDKKEARRMDRFTQFALAAAKLAYDDSGLKPESVAPERMGVIVGSAAGGIGTIESQMRKVTTKG